MDRAGGTMHPNRYNTVAPLDPADQGPAGPCGWVDAGTG